MPATHLLHVFHGFGVGGSEVRTCRIINALGRRYRHTIVALNGDFGARSLIEDQGNVTLLHPPGFLSRSYVSNVLASRVLLKRVKPDLMIAFAWGAFEWIVSNSIRKICADICAVEGFGADEAAGEKRRRRLVRRAFSRRSTRLMACSLNLRDLAVSSWHAAPDNVVYVPNGVDLANFPLRPWDLPSGRVVLGIVASLSPVKNHLLLLEAFRRLPAGVAELRIVGDGPERAAILAYVVRHGLGSRVSMLGHLADPSPLLRDVDVFCLSSRSEQMPIAVLEAMSTGLPVVSTDVGDVRHMLSEENRPFVVPPGDVDAYEAALQEMVAHPALRARVGRQNRDRCEQEFSFSLMLERHEKLYASAMNAYFASSSR